MFRTLAFFTVVGFQMMYVQADTDHSHTLYYKPNGQYLNPPYSFYKDDDTCSPGAQLTEVDTTNHYFTLELGTYTIDECPNVSGHALKVAGSDTSFTMGSSGVDWQCSITAHQDSMSGRFVAPTTTTTTTTTTTSTSSSSSQCAAPYGTADGRPAYDSTLPDCTGAAVDANGVVQQTCLCSRCGDIRVIVALPGERCDSDGYWGASKPSTGFYATHDRDDENFGYSDTCHSKCQEAYHAITKTDYRNVLGRRLRSVNKLQASYKGQNMACTKKDQHYGANRKDFECYGCKQCEEDALTEDFGFKEVVRSYGEDVGGCYVWCKPAFETATDDTRKERVCKWKRCSGCKKCSDFRETSSNKFVHKYATIQDGDIMVGGCSKWCKASFEGTAGKAWMSTVTDVTRKERVCKWKRCSGCQACVEFAEDAEDDMNDGFRFKYATKDYSGTSTGRKKTTKREGGCKEYCKDRSQQDKVDPHGHKGLDRICKWKSCNGCGVCETSQTKRNKYLNRLEGNFGGDSAKKTAFENKYGSSYELPGKTIADARGQNLYGSNENDWKPGRGCAGLKCMVLYSSDNTDCSTDKACHNCGGC